MNDAKKDIELTKQEQEEIAKLFENFASGEWDTNANQIEEVPDEQKEPPEIPSEKPRRKAFLMIGISFIAFILLAYICIKVLIPDPEPQNAYVTFSAGNHLVAAVTNDGTVLSPSAAFSLPNYTLTTQPTDVLEWRDIVSISVGTLHTLGLKSDGTVVSTGFFEPDKQPTSTWENPTDHGQTNVESWNDIIQVGAGYQHSVGLSKNGKVVAVGDNSYGQCEVEDWTNIVQISVGAYHTVGLKSDGTVVSTQIPPAQPDDGQCNVDTWTDIIFISAGSYTTIGVRKDGTVVAAGANAWGQCNVATWTNIVSVAAGLYHTVGLRSDGTVVSTGLTKDLAISYYADFGQGNVEHWKNIVAVAVTNNQTFGLTEKGTVVYAGLNTAEVNETKSWSNIRMP